MDQCAHRSPSEGVDCLQHTFYLHCLTAIWAAQQPTQQQKVHQQHMLSGVSPAAALASTIAPSGFFFLAWLPNLMIICAQLSKMLCCSSGPGCHQPGKQHAFCGSLQVAICLAASTAPTPQFHCHAEQRNDSTPPPTTYAVHALQLNPTAPLKTRHDTSLHPI